MKIKKRDIEGTYIHECEQFGADSNRNRDLVNINVVSSGDCLALAEVYALLSSILLH